MCLCKVDAFVNKTNGQLENFHSFVNNFHIFLLHVSFPKLCVSSFHRTVLCQPVFPFAHSIIRKLIILFFLCPSFMSLMRTRQLVVSVSHLVFWTDNLFLFSFFSPRHSRASEWIRCKWKKWWYYLVYTFHSKSPYNFHLSCHNFFGRVRFALPQIWSQISIAQNGCETTADETATTKKNSTWQSVPMIRCHFILCYAGTAFRWLWIISCHLSFQFYWK